MAWLMGLGGLTGLVGLATVVACALVKAGAEGSRIQSALFAEDLRRRALRPAPSRAAELPHAA